MNDGKPAGALIVGHSDDLQFHALIVDAEVEKLVSFERGGLPGGSHRCENPGHPDPMFPPVTRQSDLHT
jgi:hypothetical protein